jgi:acetyl esterase/lipase
MRSRSPSIQSRTATFLLKRLLKREQAQDSSVKTVRRAVNTFMWLTPRQSGVKVFQSRQSQLPGEWVVCPQAEAGRLVLYLHGGGYLFGSPPSHRPLTTRLSRLSGSRVLALRYRLAPEHTFPGAVEDAARAYCTLISQGVLPEKIVLAGDSAGGGLALATLIYLKQRCVPLPAGAICFSPWTDLAVTGESVRKNAERCAMFKEEALHRAARQYLGKVSPYHPLASPLYANLEGLPPLLIHVSDSELLTDDSCRIAEVARVAGVKVRLDVYTNQPHVWQLFSLLPEAMDSLRRAASSIKEWTTGVRPAVATLLPS